MYYSIVADADIPRVQQSCGTAWLKPTQGKVLPTVHREITLAESERVRAELHDGGVLLLCQANECRGRVLEAAHYLCQQQLHERSCRVSVAPRGWGTAGIAHTFQHISAVLHQSAAVRAQEAQRLQLLCVSEQRRAIALRENDTSACRHFVLSNTFLMKRSGPGNDAA